MKNTRLGWVILSLLLCCSIASAELFYPIPDQLARSNSANGQLGLEPRFTPRMNRTLVAINPDPSKMIERNATIYRRGYLPPSYGYSSGSYAAALPKYASIYDFPHAAATIYGRGWIDSSGRSLFPVWGVNYAPRITGGRPSSGGYPFDLGAPVGFRPYSPYIQRSPTGMTPNRYQISTSRYGATATNPSLFTRTLRTRATESRAYRDRFSSGLPKGYRGGPYTGRVTIGSYGTRYSNGAYTSQRGYDSRRGSE
ncbi:hypothetical protein HQ560_08055 [bacterium]|nr:hypothetical protein [bacterium]